MVNRLFKFRIPLSFKYSTILLFAAVLSGPVFSDEAKSDQQELDMEYGEEINETCAGCHGVYGQGSFEGEYPRIAGLDPDYIVKQLNDFKQRKRINIPMIPFANNRELPGNDVRVIAEYLSSIQLPTKLQPVDEENFDALERLEASKKVVNIGDHPGNIERGKKTYLKDCADCHAKDGYGIKKKRAPRLAGQYSEYLLRQIKLYRSGKRLHDDDRDDIELFNEIDDGTFDDILAYLSTLDDQ